MDMIDDMEMAASVSMVYKPISEHVSLKQKGGHTYYSTETLGHVILTDFDVSPEYIAVNLTSFPFQCYDKLLLLLEHVISLGTTICQFTAVFAHAQGACKIFLDPSVSSLWS